MQSIYDDIVTALSTATFSIPNVTIREPYDESNKTYPMIVVHEIVSLPTTPSGVNGDERTRLEYQFDIYTSNCVDSGDNVLSRWQAGKLLWREVNDVLESEFKFTRRSVRTEPMGADVLTHILRGGVVADSDGYTYRT